MGRLSAPAALERALIAHFAAPGASVAIEEIASRPWASATFAGGRHSLLICLTGEDAMTAADRALEGIEEHEFVLPGHILIDIALAGREDQGGSVRLMLETLTIEAD